jgi:hypothetical protein
LVQLIEQQLIDRFASKKLGYPNLVDWVLSFVAHGMLTFLRYLGNKVWEKNLNSIWNNAKKNQLIYTVHYIHSRKT